MKHRRKPAVDHRLKPEQGVSRDGQALSYNRAPSPDLAPWIGRLYVTKVMVPENHTIACGHSNDAASLRVQLAGDWEADTPNGRHATKRSAYVFGPQTRRIPIRVTGSFISVGISFRPGAFTTLKWPSLPTLVDSAVPSDIIDLPQGEVLARFRPGATAEEWITVLETIVRDRITAISAPPPAALSAHFEELAFRSPSMTVAAAAQACATDRRRLERTVLRDFGMSPKQVFRRARALDMASHLRGVADHAEADELILRYYDESHLIHEFTQLLGMSPGQFVAQPQPLMTVSLEVRQARRLEMLKRLAPGATRPWERNAA